MQLSPRGAQYLLLAIMALIALGVGLSLAIYLALGAALLVVVICAAGQGVSPQKIGNMIGRGLYRSRHMLIILSLISILIGLWKQNGSLATLIYFGFHFIRPKIFLPAVFVLTSLISLLLGTAVGTVSTIGIVLMGLAESMGIPAAMVAGAVVGGAYVGDRSAPTSGPLHLMAAVTDTEASQLLPYILSTLAPTYLLALVFYYILGPYAQPLSLGPETIAHFQGLLTTAFTIKPLLLLPPTLLLLLSVLRVQIIPNLFLTLGATCIFSIMEGLSPMDILKTAIYGYFPTADLPFSGVLTGGGFLSFTTILLVISTAMSLTGLLEDTGVFHQAMEGVLGRIRTVPQLILATSIFSIATAAVACTQVVSVVAPGAVFQPTYRRLGVDNLVLARTIADTGVTVSGIIPWSIAALSPALILGVAVPDFMPYAAYCWLSPLVTNLFALLGWVKKTEAEGHRVGADLKG